MDIIKEWISSGQSDSKILLKRHQKSKEEEGQGEEGKRPPSCHMVPATRAGTACLDIDTVGHQSLAQPWAQHGRTVTLRVEKVLMTVSVTVSQFLCGCAQV
jgi:hypothetical protein